MKKILIGIAAVFCAQIGFQAFLAGERTDKEYSALASPLEQPLRMDGVEPADLSFREPEQVERTTVVRTRYIERAPAPRPAYATYRKAAKQDLRPTVAAFKPVVITVPARPAETRLRTEPEQEKRSFPSKAVAVVKKPYDWLKAVASKLK